jgi:SAM-dependent methyltransferase
LGWNERIRDRLDRGRYAEFETRWDDRLLRAAVLAELDPTKDLLDLGAGAGIVPEMGFKGLARRVCGVDPDPRVVDNPHLDEGREGFGESIPYEDESFDVVVSDNVLEHLDNPLDVFREVHRVLRPGGVFLAKTPNRWHYVAIGATLTPHSFHRKFNAARGRAAEDTFPTRYRANSRGQIAKHARAAGFELLSVEFFEGRPEYLRRWAPLYALGAAYEAVVNSTRLLAPIRVVLIAKMRKPGPAGSVP